MARTRALLTDPVRSEISATLMDAQCLQDETARILADRVQKHVRQSRALQRAQQHLTASEMRAERLAWDGEKCRRQFDRRNGSVAA